MTPTQKTQKAIDEVYAFQALHVGFPTLADFRPVAITEPAPFNDVWAANFDR